MARFDAGQAQGQHQDGDATLLLQPQLQRFVVNRQISNKRSQCRPQIGFLAYHDADRPEYSELARLREAKPEILELRQIGGALQ